MKTKRRRSKRTTYISRFLKTYYGITFRDIASFGRASLLNEVEYVPCNLCGSDSHTLVGQSDKYKLNINTVVCNQCGLLFLNPRPTMASYAAYYQAGGDQNSVYHKVIDEHNLDDVLRAYYGKFFEKKHTKDDYLLFMEKQLKNTYSPQESETHGSQGSAYATDLVDYLEDYLYSGMRVFEVGASKGQMLVPFREKFGCEVSGVEPKKASVDDALSYNGVSLFQGFSDHPEIPKNHYDIIINIRTINHMLDPLSDLKYAYSWLKEGGIIFIDIQDSIEKAVFGFEESVVEIDHPYMFSVSTLSALLQKAGFEILKAEHVDVGKIYNDQGKIRLQIRITAKKVSDPVNVKLPDPTSEIALLRLRDLEYRKSLCVSKDERIEVQAGRIVKLKNVLKKAKLFKK